MNPDKYCLSESQNQEIFERGIKPDLFTDKKSVANPVAVIFGGQPGSGKSASINTAMIEFQNKYGAVQIIGDDLRGYHPWYTWLMEHDDKMAAFYTGRDIGQWVEKAISEAKAQRVNLIIEGTMRDSDKVAITMKNLRDAGYRIDARVLAVNSCLSEQGILHRYESQKAERGVGRMTTPEAHWAAYDGMLLTLERIERDKLADHVSIHRRSAEAIYTNKLQDGQWVRKPQACAVVEAERNRSMTLKECHEYVAVFDELMKMIMRPERQASTEEIQKVDKLRHQARAKLVTKLDRELTGAVLTQDERLGERRTQTPTRSVASVSQAGQGGSADGGLLETAESLEREQQALVEATPIEQTYQESLTVYIQAKHDQVERIENRLESVIDRQQARLQQIQARAPGWLSMPGTKRAWQTQEVQQQARLQTLHHRLESVREIKEGMGLHAPKIEELATRKMRAENPELASNRDAMCEAVRRHQAMLQKQTREERSRGQSLGLFLRGPHDKS